MTATPKPQIYSVPSEDPAPLSEHSQQHPVPASYSHPHHLPESSLPSSHSYPHNRPCYSEGEHAPAQPPPRSGAHGPLSSVVAAPPTLSPLRARPSSSSSSSVHHYPYYYHQTPPRPPHSPPLHSSRPVTRDRAYDHEIRDPLEPSLYRGHAGEESITPRRLSSLPPPPLAMDREREAPPPIRRHEDDRYAYAQATEQGRARYEHDYPHHGPPPLPLTAAPVVHEHSPPPPQSWPPSSGPSTTRHPAHPPAHSYPPHPPYGYPYPYGHPSQGDVHAPPSSSGGWSQWGPAYGAPVYPPGGGPPSHMPGPSQRQPTPPPPASPSQIQQRVPPPPPASAPSPKREGSSSPSSQGYLPGFQPDYDRTRDTRRPSSTEPPAIGSGSASAVYGSDVRPPPTEAYLILRPHRVPRGGWQGAQQVADSSGWTYELEVMQSPERGKALGVEALRRGWPALTPPLIVQLHVRDKDGNEVPTDNATLARRLVHLTMSVELVSPDGTEPRSMMRVRPPSPRGTVQPYYPTTAPPPYSVQRTLLGSSVRTAQVLQRDNHKGLYFIFQDMIVRPEGRYALEGKILDLAGPPHIGTSIGVTHPLAYCRTRPFDVIIPQEFPGPVSITPLSAEFLRQGERHLGRRPRNEDGEDDEADEAAHNE